MSSVATWSAVLAELDNGYYIPKQKTLHRESFVAFTPVNLLRNEDEGHISSQQIVLVCP